MTTTLNGVLGKPQQKNLIIGCIFAEKILHFQRVSNTYAKKKKKKIKLIIARTIGRKRISTYTRMGNELANIFIHI